MAKPGRRLQMREAERRYYASHRKERCTYASDRMVRLRDERRPILQTAKSRPCMDCGQSFPPVCMDFDHRNPADKSFTIADQYRQVPLSALLEEIAKCDVVCANCHRIRTHGGDVL